MIKQVVLVKYVIKYGANNGVKFFFEKYFHFQPSAFLRKKFVDNQKYQARFRPLCNKILLFMNEERCYNKQPREKNVCWFST